MSKKKNKNDNNPQETAANQPAPGADETPAEDSESPKSSDPQDSALDAEEELDALRRDLQEANERYMRTRAEIENYRKRTQREFADLRSSTKAGTIEEFLTVFDHFQMAMDHAETSEDVATLKQGMAMILKEFERAFQNLGVDQIKAGGQAFDPAVHHAVAEEPSDEVPAGEVLRQWKPGYRLGERLIRPASVVVSKGPDPAPGQAGENNSSGA